MQSEDEVLLTERREFQITLSDALKSSPPGVLPVHPRNTEYPNIRAVDCSRDEADSETVWRSMVPEKLMEADESYFSIQSCSEHSPSRSCVRVLSVEHSLCDCPS